jgi:hypothetical protein
MLSRTLGLATVMLLIGWFADPAAAQNLEAGKSPAQLFSGNCSACHRSPRGLIKTVAPGSLPGFLREHYTTSKDMAAVMAGYLTGNGGTDPRGAGGLTRQGQEAKSGGRQQPDQAAPGRRPQPGQQEAARPDVDGLGPQPSRRRPRGPDAPGAEATAPTAPDFGPGNRAKQKLGKRGQPPREEPKPEPAKEIARDPAKDEPNKNAAAPGDSAKPEIGIDSAGKPDTSAPDTDKSEQVRTEPVKPSDPAAESKPATAAVSPHHDPVPQVTPAPKADGVKSELPSQQNARAPEQPSAPPADPAPSSAVETPAATPPAPPVAASPPPPPAGPPAPPISQ